MITENQTFDEEGSLYGLKDLTVKNCRFDGPADCESAFKECRNIDVTGCFINLRYPFWHVEKTKIADTNFTENCRIIGTQPFCYCKNLVLKNCTMEECDLAFERSTIEVEVNGKIDSVKNPLAGKITADSIGHIILEEEICDKSKTQIICKE